MDMKIGLCVMAAAVLSISACTTTTNTTTGQRQFVYPHWVHWNKHYPPPANAVHNANPVTTTPIIPPSHPVVFVPPPAVPAPVVLNPNEYITTEYAPAPFSGIILKGNLNVEIDGNHWQPSVTISGPRYVFSYLNVTEKNGVLCINEDARHRWGVIPAAPLNVLICTNEVTNLSYTGIGQVTSNNIGKYGINLNVSGNSNLNLSGQIMLGQLTAANNSHVSLYWIDSNFVKVYAGDNAQVSLAGSATNLNADVSGYASINAKYLRSKQAYVETSDGSNAVVYVTKSLSALANDQSTIYYYPDPEIIGPYDSGSGSVLRMAGLPY